MNSGGVAKRLATAAKILLATSLFTVLIWFTASVLLFAVCLVLYGVAGLMDDHAVPALRLPTIPE